MTQPLILGISAMLQEIKRITEYLAATSNGVQLQLHKSVDSQVGKPVLYYDVPHLISTASPHLAEE